MSRLVITLDIADVMAAIETEFEKRYPTDELRGVIVKSWNTTVFSVIEGTLQDPRHHVRNQHKEWI